MRQPGGSMGAMPHRPAPRAAGTATAGGLAAGAAAIVLGLALAACGVPTDTHPTPVPNGQIPAALEAPAPTSAPVPAPKGAVALPDIYLVAGNRLTAVPREGIAPRSPDDYLTEVLVTLQQGPTLAEAGRGMRSAIGEQVNLSGHMLRGGQAAVDLSQEISTIGGLDKVLALAQIVCTVTGIPGVKSVSFTLAGAPVAVPVANGQLVERPLGAGDYTSLILGSNPAALPH